MNLYETMGLYLDEGKAGVVATVVKKTGAAPRDEGAKMFIGEDRKSYGTVGGGRVEAEVYDEALRLMGTRKAKIVHFRMDAKEVAGDGMLCGGNVDVLLEPLLGVHKEVYEGVRHCETRGRKAVVVTRFGSGSFLKTLFDTYGTTWGDAVPEEELKGFFRLLDEKKVQLIGDSLVVEPVSIAPVLYIFGAGHVSQFLSKVAKMVDFNVVVIDDRAEFANQERFPEADSVVVEDFLKVFDNLAFTGNEYVVIVTRGHAHDAAVLEETVKRETRYIGMIGSKRKVRMVLQHLREKGANQKVLDKVHSPVGLEIHSETPQEIAISIVAELIQVRGS
ncbi:MAG: putative xanthine dehydrogenase subunit A [Syntrophorhabdus sp. PtaU1.Bin002]|nr:MAG: putative xanthine dehydrogenase subunit A [Syntrophorhabdus sp. PtaU1.Bin002]